MTAHDPNAPPQDEEIIELTDVVEEPEAAGTDSGETPSQDQQVGQVLPEISDSGAEHNEDPRIEDDEFDFSTLFQEDEFSESQDSSNDEMEQEFSATGEQDLANDSHQDPFAEIDDIFEELDLDISADQTASSREREWPQQDRGRLQALEQRVQELENAAASPEKETWKDIEERIMRRLEQLVDEKFRQTAEDLKQEVQAAAEQAAAAHAGQLEELADTVQEQNQNSVGPETVAALKNELWTELTQRIEDAIPRLAAQVIRREIQTLLKDEEEPPAGDGPKDDPA